MEPRSFTLRLQGHWGERLEGGFGVDVWLRFALTAMGISVLEEMLVFDWFYAFILLRLEGHWGERFGGLSLGCF